MAQISGDIGGFAILRGLTFGQGVLYSQKAYKVETLYNFLFIFLVIYLE